MTPGDTIRAQIHNWRKGRGLETITGTVQPDTPHPAYLVLKTADNRIIGLPKDMVQVIQYHPSMVKCTKGEP